MTLHDTDTSWQMAAERAPAEAREQFYAWGREMLAVGVPEAVVRVLGHELFLKPDEPDCPPETSPPTPRDPLLLTDDEWLVLEPHFSTPKSGPAPDYRAMLDNYLRRVLRKKKWKDVGGSQVRMQVRALARNGAWRKIADALDLLPLSPARRKDLERVCQAAILGASRRKSRA